jgi:hypothetical protein
MSRRFRWILLALVVVVIGAAATLVVLERPKLDDARNAVDARWAPLRAPTALGLRYQKLAGALSAFDASGGNGRSVSKDLHAALDGWNRALKSGDAGAQAAAADTVESLATRLRANVDGSDRLKADPAVNDALAAFAGTAPPAVRKYEDQRSGTLQRPVARLLSYDARPLLVLGV